MSFRLQMSPQVKFGNYSRWLCRGIRALWQVMYTQTVTEQCELGNSQCEDGRTVQQLLRKSNSQVINLCVVHGMLWLMNFRYVYPSQSIPSMHRILHAYSLDSGFTDGTKNFDTPRRGTRAQHSMCASRRHCISLTRYRWDSS